MRQFPFASTEKKNKKRCVLGDLKLGPDAKAPDLFRPAFGRGDYNGSLTPRGACPGLADSAQVGDGRSQFMGGCAARIAT